jgi:hypothetical protein
MSFGTYVVKKLNILVKFNIPFGIHIKVKIL